MKRATKDVLYFEIGADNAPTLRVQPGEEFEVETQMNRGLWPPGHPRAAEEAHLRGGNPSSGCVYVEGAAPGQVLAVHVGPIDLDPLGFTDFSDSAGVHHRQVEVRDGLIHWSAGVQVPAAPMLGFVGVAPRYERISNGWGGDHGGNLDVQEVTTGATLYLPVAVPGALLHVGDMHARQGDGEVCGIEASGRVRLRCELLPRPASWRGPRIEDATHIAAVGFARPAEDAFRKALEALMLWLAESYGLGRAEAHLRFAWLVEARSTQFVNPTYSYVAKIARRWLPAGERPTA